MKIRDTATVIHRMWGDLTGAELLGAFTYQMDAKIVAEALISLQPEGVVLIVTDLGSGEMSFVHKPKPKAVKAS